MSKCWYCNNELTTGDSPKHFGICNKCYDEMFRSGDTIIRSFINKISDLEAKLAESEEQLKEELVEKKCLERALSACNRQNDEFAEMIKKLVSEKEELKQQLAEKDKELAYMTEQAKKFNNEAQKYFEDAYCNDFHKRDKISFAVEQLEKVKKDIDCYMAIREGDLPYDIECLLLDFADKIDNQIKQLKH